MDATRPLPIDKRAWAFSSLFVFLLCSLYLRDWPLSVAARFVLLPIVALVAVSGGWILQFFWSLLVSVLPKTTPPRSWRQKLLTNWAGCISILWMVGMYEAQDYVPDFFLNFSPSWLSLCAVLGGWLGVGLLFAITGLRCGSNACRVCCLIAILTFLYFVRQLLFPPYEVIGCSLRFVSFAHNLS